MNFRFLFLVAGLVVLVCLAGTVAYGQAQSEVDFAAFDKLGLSDALDLSISIASGKIQSLEEAPGIVSVITDEDIRRLGVQTLSELLKTVPGFDILVDSTGRDRIAVRGFLSQDAYSEGC